MIIKKRCDLRLPLASTGETGADLLDSGFSACYDTQVSDAGVAELADARDLKSREGRPSYRFDPGHRHQPNIIRTTSSQLEMGSDFLHKLKTAFHKAALRL